jgi:hypothetical protein
VTSQGHPVVRVDDDELAELALAMYCGYPPSAALLQRIGRELDDELAQRLGRQLVRLWSLPRSISDV